MMKNKLRYFIMTIILMIMSILSGKAMVVFDALVDKGVYNQQTGMVDITKDGITISVSSTDSVGYSYYDGESFASIDVYSINSNIVMTIESKYSQMKMVAFNHTIESFGAPDFNGYSRGKFESTSNGQYDYYCHSSYWDGHWKESSIDYGIWTGNANKISFSSGSDNVCFSQIIIFVNEDVLPEKNIYADVFTDWDFNLNYVRFIYGYKEFTNSFSGDYSYSWRQYGVSEDNLNEVLVDETYGQIIAVTFDHSFADYYPKSTSHWFKDCTAKEITGLEYLNTSEVTNMSYMFAGCQYLTALDLTKFDTSHVKNMECMFSDCEILNSLDLSNFDTSNVTNMSGMFGLCYNLTSLDVSHFNTSNVTDMSYMFEGIYKLTSIDISNFDTKKLERSSNMLGYCTALKEITISSTMNNLSEDTFYGIGTPNNPCILNAPANIDLGPDSYQDYFYWKGGYFKTPIKTVAVLSENNSTLTFYRVNNPTAYGDSFYGFNTADTNPTWYNERANITKVVFDPSFAESRPTSTFGWFRGMENLEEIEGLEYLNTSETTLMSYMFYGCSKLKNIDVSHFDTKNVEKMGYMFQNCTSLESIDISNFDYTKNTSCYRMFNGCTNLKSIITGEWKNNANDQYGYLFSGCSSLETLDLSQLNLSSDAKTGSMLNGCTSLELLSISLSMSVLNSAACSGVGSATNPCDITAPDDFNYGVDTSVEPFRWKSGYFRLASKLFAEASDVKFGNVYDLRISLRNGSHVYNGYQFNVHLPEGFDLTEKPRAGYDYTLSNRYATTPSIRITPQDDGSYQVLAYSTNDATITGSEGLIITLPLTVGEGLAVGNYTGTITDVTFNNPDNTSAYLQDADFNIFVPAFGMGDVNHDRSINITDVMMTVNHVVGQTPSGFHVEDADINGDHVVNISDIMAIVNLLVSASTANAPAIMREAITDAITLIPTNCGYAVSLKNNEPYTALQMDIQMPNGAPLNASLTDNRSDGHTVISNDLGNGHYRIAIYSLNSHTIKGNDGILLQLQTNGKQNDIPEIYDVQLTNRLFESITLSNISIPTDITNMNDDGGANSPAYNVQGIRVPKHHRGIIIQNGKKQMTK